MGMRRVGLRRVGMWRRLRILQLGRVRFLGGGEEDAASGDAASADAASGDAASGDDAATEDLVAGASKDPGGR